jgi:ribosomal protein L5
MGAKAKVERGEWEGDSAEQFLERGQKLKKGRSRKGGKKRERDRVGVVVVGLQVVVAVNVVSGDRVGGRWPVIGMNGRGRTRTEQNKLRLFP